jgi:membrane associated rhomboid family serine protease
MIIPWLKGFLSWQKAPLTWTLIFVNVFIFGLTMEPQTKAAADSFATVEMMSLTGRLYYQYRNPDDDEMPVKDLNEWMVLGSQGLKDPAFIHQAPELDFYGDDLAIQKWKKKVVDYEDALIGRSSRIFGLQTQNSTPLSWITYQFMHAGFMHLLGNMLMLLLFGGALEMSLGGIGLLGVYLFGGIAGAAGFLALSSATVAPMIGASGSLSAIMAFYAAFEHRRRISFFYFVSPIHGYWGWIYLPTLIIFPLCFLPDLVGYLSTPAEFGDGIAYAAHMGGALFGALLGFGCRQVRFSSWFKRLSNLAKS